MSKLLMPDSATIYTRARQNFLGKPPPLFITHY